MAEINLTNFNNFTGSSIFTEPSNLIPIEKCKSLCLEQTMAFNYEFVWFFVIGFIFNESSSFIFRSKRLSPELRNSISGGMKLAGYILNLVGILWFLIII